LRKLLPAGVLSTPRQPMNNLKYQPGERVTVKTAKSIKSSNTAIRRATQSRG
jgi:hypothetical protein